MNLRSKACRQICPAKTRNERVECRNDCDTVCIDYKKALKELESKKGTK